MTPHERSMVEFVVKWYRFGNGDEYILPAFGIAPGIFYQRVLWLLDTDKDHYLDSRTEQQLREFCMRKLSLLSPEGPQPTSTS
ncbi:hypothetical protein [Nocardia fusca]|uniref:hypothetical protein n=1 Tax=Nocardia fusca TaxID=941183 RepID=UPI0007A74C90|nr:hypothetical protein [Nocardia fusca]